MWVLWGCIQGRNGNWQLAVIQPFCPFHLLHFLTSAGVMGRQMLLQIPFTYFTWVVNALLQDCLKVEVFQPFDLPVKTPCTGKITRVTIVQEEWNCKTSKFVNVPLNKDSSIKQCSSRHYSYLSVEEDSQLQHDLLSSGQVFLPGYAVCCYSCDTVGRNWQLCGQHP